MLTAEVRRGATVTLVVAVACVAAAALAVAAWSVRPWQLGESAPATELTGPFGGDCTPTAHSSTICFCNAGRSVCVAGETYLNGVGRGARPPSGARVTVRVAQVEHHGVRRPTVVALVPN